MASSPICVLFISCVSALARSSSTALSRSGENSRPSVGAFLGEMLVFPSRHDLAVGFGEMPFIRLRSFQSSPHFLSFLFLWCVFFLIYLCFKGFLQVFLKKLVCSILNLSCL